MFESFTLKNFCTHKNTEIKFCGPVILFIGGNSSGKTNFLKGIYFLSKIVSQARPRDDIENIRERTRIKRQEFNSFYYRWANDEPMELSCKWRDREENFVEYKVSIRSLEKKIVGKEFIFIKPKNGDGFKDQTNETEYLDLRINIHEADLDPEIKKIGSRFFADLSSICLYHFQPYVLKSSIKSRPTQELMGKKNKLILPWSLEKEGENFVEIIGYIRDNEKKIYDKMISFLRIIDEKFESVRKENSNLRWFYKPEKSIAKLYNFTTEQISDGFIKCAAISLLVSLDKAPSLIMLEEIENGINPLYIRYVIKWLYQATGEKNSILRGYVTQFILTTYSPIVLREFVDNLNCVYTFRRMDKNFESKVNNLQEVIKMFIEVGTIDGEIDNEKVIITKDQLESLWLKGLIG